MVTDCGTNMAHGSRQSTQAPSAAQFRAVERARARYVGRFATTRAKLRVYLARKIRERGWEGPREPDLAAIADRFAAPGYIDDAAYALSNARALSGRGYGKHRLVQKLRAAGVEEQDGQAAREHADAEAAAAAVRFAERRRIGPFAAAAHAIRGIATRRSRRWSAPAIRFGLARAILDLPPGSEIDLEDLAGFSAHR